MGKSTDKKVTRRRFLKGLTIAGAGSVLASRAWAPARAAVVQKQVHVVFWNWLDRPETPDFPALIKVFESQHPDIKIDWELGAYAQQHDRLVSALAGGAGPDAFEADTEWIGELVGMGALEPIDKYMAKWPGRSDIYPKVLEQFQYEKGSPGGVGPLYGLPFLLTAQYLYFRRDWAKEVGFTGSHPGGGPATMEEFLTYAKAVTDPKKPRYGFAMRGGRGGTGMWLNGAGSMGMDVWGWTNKAKREWRFDLDSEKSIKAHTWYVELFTKYRVCPPSAPTDSFAEIMGNMKSGLTAMTFHHIWSSQEIGNVIGMDNLGVVPVPKGPNPKDWKTYGGAGANSINARAKPEVKEAAFQWISFIASANFNRYWIEHQGGVPYNPSLAKDPKIAADRFVKATLEGAPSWTVYPTTPGMGEFESNRWPASMGQVLTGKMSPEQMMKDLNTFLNQTKG
jgi:multiple sugar transport system substrate-binding protein